MNPPAPRALIAEDEPLLAAALRQELARAWPALEVVATVGDGLSAVQQALALRPDVLFFDIRMPGQTGLDAAVELADAWPADAPFPALVFATAYDQYAVQAFDAQAVDYLLKPIEARRLARTVAKVQDLLAQRHASAAPAAAMTPPGLEATMAQLRALLQAPGVGATPPPPPSQPAQPAARLSVIQASHGSQIHMVPVAEVVYFEAADKYVRVLTTEREYLIRTALKELIEQLDPQEFWQVHRSTLVRATHIATVTRDEAGKQHITLRGRPERLPVSRLYAHLFKAM
ncbi:LytR/AlgR family response regulator transcription factor [Acidovorax kalamii]|jgi:DNA-binding LytR/AlgR family response regulator|uniref:DNA-binding response regulator n=1 Tax=Acidovorax kalamii TaxID=2004485 RepID=A0A235EP34_9BURK|nr:LytTR family DNA-binding domain-containing protein [Acidovorax kalamii]MCO5355311.1 LytTR family DNA-binding domain-containing protein [Acidovorax kalamii]OYD50808.1 DNA-binding response regulator [Acidovorax kalamii]